MNKNNLEIRQLIESNGLKYWEVADRLGIADTTFSRRLRKELPEERKAEIREVVGELKGESKGNG